MTWTVARARDLAESCLGGMGDRWLHVQAVGRSAEELQARGLDVSDAVVMAAWLHDVGYGESVAETGFHPVDGARWLQEYGVPPAVVALVAHQSGARFEAEERSLTDALAQFPDPDPDQLDVLTLIDMSTSPNGKRVAVSERLEEILDRYPTADSEGSSTQQSESAVFGFENSGPCAGAFRRVDGPHKVQRG